MVESTKGKGDITFNNLIAFGGQGVVLSRENVAIKLVRESPAEEIKLLKLVQGHPFIVKYHNDKPIVNGHVIEFEKAECTLAEIIENLKGD